MIHKDVRETGHASETGGASSDLRPGIVNLALLTTATSDRAALPTRKATETPVSRLAIE